MKIEIESTGWRRTQRCRRQPAGCRREREPRSRDRGDCKSLFLAERAAMKINLALADIKNVGPIFDLPIAVGTVAESHVRLPERTSGHAMTIVARSPSPSLAPRTEPLRYYLVHPY
jgi:hypothetical protein